MSNIPISLNKYDYVKVTENPNIRAVPAFTNELKALITFKLSDSTVIFW